MPELHGNSTLKTAPQMMRVVVEAEQFENLMYVWESFNNFSDFFNIPTFSLTELQAALSFNYAEDRVHTAFEQEIDSSQEITSDPFQGYTWPQRCSIQQIKESGFHLINQIHITLIEAIIKDINILNNGSVQEPKPNPITGLRSIASTQAPK